MNQLAFMIKGEALGEVVRLVIAHVFALTSEENMKSSEVVTCTINILDLPT